MSDTPATPRDPPPDTRSPSPLSPLGAYVLHRPDDLRRFDVHIEGGLVRCAYTDHLLTDEAPR